MYDLIIKNGCLYDGTGRDAYRADIGITGDRIAGIGSLKNENALKILDVQGKAVTPGFIEPHSHVDMSVLFHPSMETYLMQGVTTVVSGNCGHGMAPMGEEVYRSAVDADLKALMDAEPSFFRSLPPTYLEKKKIAPYLSKRYHIELDWNSFREFNEKCGKLPIDCNIAPLAGYSAIRNAVMGMDCEREATEDELVLLEQLTRECMEQGAFGLSTGRNPAYVPSVCASDEEIIRMLKIVKEYDGIFASHTANFHDGRFDRMFGYEEFFRQARASGVRANISHLQLECDEEDPAVAVPEAQRLIQYLEQMERDGVDLTYDIIPMSGDFILCPYLASQFAPLVLMTGTRKKFSECLAVPDFRQMIRTLGKTGMMPALNPEVSAGIFDRLRITSHKIRAIAGRTIGDCAREYGTGALDFAMQLLTEDADTRVTLPFQPCTEAYDILLNHRMAMPCLDGSSVTKETNYSRSEELPEYPAPFYYNGMIRYLLRSAKPRFEDTVRQMSGFVAERFGIEKRGFLKEGYFADILVIDRENLRSYEQEEKRKYPDGLDCVFVNGILTIEKKKYLGKAAGRVLKKRVLS